MIKVYLKQALQLLKQNKLFSTIYIVGTGIAIAMVMVIAIVYYIKIAPIYPETNRNRTLSVAALSVLYPNNGGMSSSGLSYQLVRDRFYTLKTPEAVSAVLEDYGENNFVEHTQDRIMIPVKLKFTDDNFWKVFEFDFVDGRPFSHEDFESGIHTAVISASLANTLFGTVQAEGRRIVLDADEYRVSGVVRDISFATPNTYAQIWLPFTLRQEELVPSPNGEGYLGAFEVYMLSPSASANDDVIDEVNEVFHKINSGLEKYQVDLCGYPDTHWKSNFRIYGNHPIDWGAVAEKFGIILLALLLVPAVNLAGMVSSRMERRLPEMGLRKAFGASRSKLLNQLLYENLLLTLLGGVVGLILSYFIILMGRNWILTLFDRWPDAVPEGIDTTVTTGMLFNPGVFLIAFLVCFVLNLLSAIIPAYNGLKKNIIYSLNEKK